MFLPFLHTAELEGSDDFRWRTAGILLGGFLLIAYWQQWIVTPFQWDLAILLTFLFGYQTFRRAFRDLLARRISADQAVAIAALAALYVGEYLAAAEVVYIMLVGETLEAYAARRFQGDLNRLLTCLPETAHVLRDGTEEQVELTEVREDDEVVVYPGQRIPVDGSISDGDSLIDENTITGESVPREKGAGASVYAGTLNQTGRLLVRAEQIGERTVLKRIVELVHHAKENKAPVQRTADRYARWFVPLVLTVAGICYLVTGEWMRSVAILIVACPCAMVLATPAAVLASVSAMARRGIVVKGGVYLERLSEVDCVAFDKTGTLTQGHPELIDVIQFNGYSPAQILTWAASLERYSDHILARAIRRNAEEKGLVLEPVEDVASHTGLGVEGTLSPVASSQGATTRDRIRVGSARYLENQGLTLHGEEESVVQEITSQGGIAVLVARQEQICGVLVLRDLPRPSAREALHQLHHLNIQKTLILTGDHLNSAQQVAEAVGIDEVHAGLLPEEKLDRLEELSRQGYKVAMVGDGINDSPALALAHVGVAMGDTGTDIAADAAGVVLMDEGLDRLGYVIEKSRKTVKKIRENILWFGFAFNLTAVLAAFTGYLSAVAAAVVHQVSSLLVLLSSLSLLERGGLDWLPHRVQHAIEALEGYVQAIRSPRVGLSAIVEWLQANQKAVVRTAAAAVPLLYVLSGVRMLAPDQIGIVERFGRVLETELEPGLHYLYPWPVDRLYRLRPEEVQSIELGFRVIEADEDEVGPPAYEWNIQHRDGRYRREPDEALMLTGDEYLVEINAVVHYSIQKPALFLFRTDAIESVLRAVSEGVLHRQVASTALDRALALDRKQLEEATATELRRSLAELNLGVQIHSVLLQDVHPALEVVGAFREVASALEEKNRLINEAQGYANERLPLARGESQERLLLAAAGRFSKIAGAEGEAQRFSMRQEQYRKAPLTTRVRLYLETVEKILQGKTKYILDHNSGRRKIMLLQNSVFDVGDLESSLRSRPDRGTSEQ